MKALIIPVLLIIIALLSTSSAEREIPACLQKMIDAFHATPRFSPYTSIDSYMYRGNVVYFAASGCCDRFNPLFDSECNQICAPSGGFIGRGDGKCVDFNEKATRLENIWAAPRG